MVRYCRLRLLLRGINRKMPRAELIRSSAVCTTAKTCWGAEALGFFEIHKGMKRHRGQTLLSGRQTGKTQRVPARAGLARQPPQTGGNREDAASVSPNTAEYLTYIQGTEEKPGVHKLFHALKQLFDRMASRRHAGGVSCVLGSIQAALGSPLCVGYSRVSSLPSQPHLSRLAQAENASSGAVGTLHQRSSLGC